MKKNLMGTVISNKMNKTVIVKTKITVKNIKYKKLTKSYSKFFVHDENNKCNIGDIILFKEVRNPIFIVVI